MVRHGIGRVLSWFADIARLMRRVMGRLFMVAAVLIVAGCSGDGDFIGSPHAYQGKVGSFWGVDIDGVPTVVPDGASPMGYRMSLEGEEDIYTTYDDGTLKATGRAAYALALARLCAVAPGAEVCGMTALQEMLANIR